MILGLRTYDVRAVDRAPLLSFMLQSLREAGCRILYEPPADRAPFVISFETATGERFGIVAYAFLATRTPTLNRPANERSFQIKYGSNDHALHELWQDPLGLFVTLLIGIDPNEGFFVAADPVLHNPTRFFIRLEFKDEHAELIRANGWHAWEREHRGPRHMLASERAFDREVLVGGTAAHFLDLVRFERLAKGQAPGERQLLAEKPEVRALGLETFGFAESSAHPLETELDLGREAILELIDSARRLKMAVRGWAAEEKLRAFLAALPGVTSCQRLDRESSPDLELRWQHGPLLTIECKNVLRKPNAKGQARIDFQRTRAAKGDPCSRYYAPGDFDVLAGCLHAVTERWEFKFVRPPMLDPHRTCVGKLASNVAVDERWMADPAAAFAAASG
ncbi:hypothetical protein RHAL1_01748 [Beijerinckiaceae bacterium RH AL1]|nr:hypothetical protein [Beijerinckiaceae bacterium]VVB45401.1 hypothetical protein RHCH11_RHCH11_01710 [Beijerinckiaceae bacterium RH CH11]VVB45478.1 hypothetical protein RHAL8_01706 [Beijerinckiaceae bacterium RH AL8]VVC54847.1 hypothetical protein RHAL1_01748 [Beijerinckiaceae bacterium RH AL1]